MNRDPRLKELQEYNPKITEGTVERVRDLLEVIDQAPGVFTGEDDDNGAIRLEWVNGHIHAVLEITENGEELYVFNMDRI